MRFHDSLYSPTAIDRATEVFEKHGEFERREAAPYLEVVIRPSEGESSQILAAEFCNYVLALTVEENRDHV